GTGHFTGKPGVQSTLTLVDGVMDERRERTDAPATRLGGNAPGRAAVALDLFHTQRAQSSALGIQRRLALRAALEHAAHQGRLGPAELGHDALREDETVVLVEIIAEGNRTTRVLTTSSNASPPQARALSDGALLQLSQGSQKLEQERSDRTGCVEGL